MSGEAVSAHVAALAEGAGLLPRSRAAAALQQWDGIGLPPERVMPRLLKEAANPMPPGGIYNSIDRERDKSAAVVWQIYYAVWRVWSAQEDRLPGRQLGGGELQHRIADDERSHRRHHGRDAAQVVGCGVG